MDSNDDVLHRAVRLPRHPGGCSRDRAPAPRPRICGRHRRDLRGRGDCQYMHRYRRRGCPGARRYAQRAPEELASLPGCSWVVGNSHKPEIPWLIDSIAKVPATDSANGFVPASALGEEKLSLLHGPAKILTGNIFEQREFLAAPVIGGEGNHTRPVVKIQDGCNSRCAYCVIPFVRGRSRSLPPAQAIEEIARLSASGYREVVLSGINLGTYGRDLSPRVELIDLLQRILDEATTERLRISSIEP